MSTHDTGNFMPWEQRYSEAKLEFEKQFPQAFEVMKVGGVHPDKTESIPNPYKDNEPDNEDFRNVGEHCVSVSICASKIADKLLEVGAIDEEACRNITERSLIHDTNKRFEVFRKKARGNEKTEGVYDKPAYETMQELLQDRGVSSDLIEYIKTAGQETGHNSMSDFIVLENGNVILNSDRTLAEMIVHLADDMTFSPLPGTKGDTKFVTTKERMDGSKFLERYPFLYKEGLGFDSDGKVIEVKDCTNESPDLQHVYTYAQYQEMVAKLICDYLQKQIEPEAVDDSEQFIKNIVNR